MGDLEEGRMMREERGMRNGLRENQIRKNRGERKDGFFKMAGIASP